MAYQCPPARPWAAVTAVQRLGLRREDYALPSVLAPSQYHITRTTSSPHPHSTTYKIHDCNMKWGHHSSMPHTCMDTCGGAIFRLHQSLSNERTPLCLGWYQTNGAKRKQKSAWHTAVLPMQDRARRLGKCKDGVPSGGTTPMGLALARQSMVQQHSNDGVPRNSTKAFGPRFGAQSNCHLIEQFHILARHPTWPPHSPP